MKTFRQLIAFRNIVPLVAIILAFLGASGFLQGVFTTEQTILILLGILAVDMVVERLGYLSRIEDGIKSISVAASKPLFLSRAMLETDEPFTQFVERGRQDVLLAGLTLAGTVGPFRTVFKKAVQQGTNLRFLLLDPESPCPELAAHFHGVSSGSMRSDIESSLSYLQQLMDSVSSSNSGTVQVRLLRTIPNASIAMRDGNRDTGEIRYELYLYQTDVAGRPAFRLTPPDGEIYRRFRDAIERLWNDSQPWIPK